MEHGCRTENEWMSIAERAGGPFARSVTLLRETCPGVGWKREKKQVLI